MRVGASSRREQGVFVSGGFFELLGVTPILGRSIDADDDRRGGGAHGPVAVISYAYWERAFGRDPNVLGRTVTIERVPFTIVGVTPRPFFGPEVGRSFSVAVPFGTEPLLHGSGSMLDERRNWWLNILMRRRVDQTEAQVQTAVGAMTRGGARGDAHAGSQLPEGPAASRRRGAGTIATARPVPRRAVHPDGRGGHRAAGHVRQRREPAARACDDAAGGDERAAGHRRVTLAARAAAARRERRVVRCWAWRLACCWRWSPPG